MNKDVDTLARTIWGEARGEPLEGRVAVANVVMNRTRHGGWYGHTPREVCLKPWQFSCWNASDPNRREIEDVPVEALHTRDCVSIAALAVGGFLHDVTNGATHYCRTGVRPYWAEGRAPTTYIGHHSFSKLD